MQEDFSLRGCYMLTAHDAKTGRLLKAWRLDNQLTAINRDIRTQMLMGTYAGAGNELTIKYFAFGDGSTPAAVTDTALENERLRKQVTQLTQPSANTVQSIVSLGSGEANFVIREIGVFCGPNATDAAGSGTLLSRVIVNVDKNSNIILNVVRSDICTI